MDRRRAAAHLCTRRTQQCVRAHVGHTHSGLIGNARRHLVGEHARGVLAHVDQHAHRLRAVQRDQVVQLVLAEPARARACRLDIA